MDVPICLRLFMQVVERAFSRAWFNAGSSMAASIAMIAITTRSSINVNDFFFICIILFSSG